MSADIEHSIEDVIRVFNSTFADSHQTHLVSGSSEPLYAPASNRAPYHRIIFAHGFYRSALHEVAHWCVAGKVRRHITDYGYWYKPDGRNALEQRAFEKVEVKPQALEWLFSLSCGHKFEVSCDNLAGSKGADLDGIDFTHAVAAQLASYIKYGAPTRVASFAKALQTFYGRPAPTLQDINHVTALVSGQNKNKEVA